MKTATTFALVLAVFAVSATGADAHLRKKKGYYGDSYVSSRHVRPQVRGYIARGGGHAYGYEYEPYIRQNGPYGNTPYFDDRNFWERVQSGPFSNETGISGY